MRGGGHALGFYLQVLLSLGPLMLKQFDLVTTSGYWALKGLETPWGGFAELAISLNICEYSLILGTMCWASDRVGGLRGLSPW